MVPRKNPHALNESRMRERAREERRAARKAQRVALNDPRNQDARAPIPHSHPEYMPRVSRPTISREAPLDAAAPTGSALPAHAEVSADREELDALVASGELAGTPLSVVAKNLANTLALLLDQPDAAPPVETED